MNFGIIGPGSHLKKLPIDEPKIAHQFKLDTVTEDVETQAQLEFLKYEGCDIYQGYFYRKPLPFNQLKALLKKVRVSFNS